jgi:hypothetical protein
MHKRISYTMQTANSVLSFHNIMLEMCFESIYIIFMLDYIIIQLYVITINYIDRLYLSIEYKTLAVD